MTQKISVYLGRFQPLHNGHIKILDKIFQNENDLGIILVGSAFCARTIKNPFAFFERKEMIQNYLNSKGISEKRYEIRPVPDQIYNDSKWIQSVQEQVSLAVDDFCIFMDKEAIIDDYEIYLVGSDRDSSTWYLKAFPQWKLDLSTPIGNSLNATKLRAMIFDPDTVHLNAYWSDMPKTTTEYLENVFLISKEFKALKAEYSYVQKYKKAWEAAPYPFNNVAADAVVIQSGHVLLVQRAALPGKGLWALPGGHVGQNDRCQAAAIRELVEETGIKIPEKVLKASIIAKEVFDAPDRSLLGRCYSHTFLFRLDDTQPLPKVKGQNAPLSETDGKYIQETRKAVWIPISEARAMPEKFFDDHHAILDWALGIIKD